ncbi:2-amino-4-hydroxy-6-hydroxymethyldihydropteridine diphosphokinase [Rhodobacterales bacterium HKCCSP123]|nr:2-amino-4-hydroxy-6-hydroxymethyldihydropteridine diphosphokinase [Rhodobacterales bacterium HKCCSP123]
MSRAFIAFGANLPRDGHAPEVAVADAIAALGKVTGCPVTPSRLYRTPAFPPGSGPDFVNAVVALDWRDTPEALLSLLHKVEAAFGRTRTARWEARLMDLDLIALDDRVCPDAATQARWAALSPERAAVEAPGELILPHPRLAERSFVLVPLAEIAPDWRHPVTGHDVLQMLGDRPAEERAEIRPIDADDESETPS